MRGQDLSEDLGGDFEVSVVVEVLEEALGIESVFADNFLEISNDFLDLGPFVVGWLLASVVSGGAGVVEHDVHRLFEFLLCEDLVDVVRKHFPLDVFALLWRFEMFS